MLELPEGFPCLKAVGWSGLQPGMVYAGGLTINGTVPWELRDYPVLTPGMLADLRRRYQLQPGARVLVLAEGEGAWTAERLSETLREASGSISRLNRFRKNIRELKTALNLAVDDEALTHKLLVDERESLLRQGKPKAGFLNLLAEEARLADFLSGQLSGKFALPKERPFRLLILADYSFSVRASGKDDLLFTTVNFFIENLVEAFPLAKLTVAGFSDEVRFLKPPLSGNELPRKETKLDAALERVLRMRPFPEKIIHITDGLPTDQPAALRVLAKLPQAQIRYTQVILRMDNDQREITLSQGAGLDGYAQGDVPDSEVFSYSGESYEAFLREQKDQFRSMAEAAGGDQIILLQDKALGLVSLEITDRWLGGLDKEGRL